MREPMLHLVHGGRKRAPYTSRLRALICTCGCAPAAACAACHAWRLHERLVAARMAEAGRNRA